MKKILVLIGALAIAPTLVIISCMSTSARIDGNHDKINLNTGPDKNGDIFSIQVIDRLDRVLVLDMTDRSKRMELNADDWSYDPKTTKITVKRAIPYINPVYHLEGSSEKPLRFILLNAKTGDNPIVFMDKRVAIDDIDYFWNPQTSLLTLRKNVNLDKPGFYVDYITNDGSACFGDMGEAEDADRIEYFLAQKRRDDWKEKIEKGDDFPFLEKKASGDPVVVMRKPDPQEKLELLSNSAPIIKSRDKDASAISKEVGFDARIPEKVKFSDSSAFALSGIKMILETVNAGTVGTSVMCYYQLSDKGPRNGEDSIPITLSPIPRAKPSSATDFIISEMPIPDSPQVKKTVFWSISQDERGYTVTKMVAYRGISNKVYFEVSCSADPQVCERAEEIIRAFLALRK